MSEWVTPKTNWTENDYFNLDPDYNRIKGNIQYIKDFSTKMYADFPMITMGNFTVDGFPADTILNDIEDNVTKLETNLFKPPGNIDMARYTGGAVGWNAEQLNIIESNILRLHDAMAGQWNLIPTMAFSMGTSADEF